MKVSKYSVVKAILVALMTMVSSVVAFGDELSGLDIDAFRFPTIAQVDASQVFVNRDAIEFFGYSPSIDVLPEFIHDVPRFSGFDFITKPDLDRYIPDVFNSFSYEIARRFDVWLSF